MLYGLKMDQEAGLQVVCSSEGVDFDQLPQLVFQMDDLSEFEQHRAARQLKTVQRRPCTSVTNLSHLIKEPMMSFASEPEDAVQYKMEVYQLPDKGAEIVMEYPADASQMPWFAMMAGQQGSDGSDQREPSQAWASGSERLTFALSEQEVVSLLSLCRSVSRG